VGVQWNASLNESQYWAILHDSAHPRAAMAEIDIATDAARQALFAAATSLGPSTTAGVALLPAARRAQSPSLPSNLQAALAVDEEFWLENGEKLEARFAAWLAK